MISEYNLYKKKLYKKKKYLKLENRRFQLFKDKDGNYLKNQNLL
jgi:hypothetical protein